MAKIKHYAKPQKKNGKSADPRDLILEWMAKEDRDMSWLAKHTGIQYHSLYTCFRFRNYPLNDDFLDRINKLLKTNFKPLKNSTSLQD